MARPGPGVLGAPRLAPRLLLWLLLLLLQWPESAGAQAGPRAPCAAACTCAGDSLDCSGRGLATLPRDLPSWTRSLNLSYNRLSEIDSAAFEDLTNLQEVYLNSNELTAIPSLGAASIGVVSLFLQHNKILSVDGSQLKSYLSLEVLDLSSNNITEIRSSCFPNGLRIRELNLASNRISILESGAFDGLSRSLLTLRLSKNRITQLPVKAFKLPRLTQLDLNRNRIRLIEGLTFQGLDSLEVLRLQRNNISRLTDGAFWGLSKMHVLHLEYNSLVEVNSGSLYGLTALHQLHLSNNSISRIQRDGWSFCQKLHELILSFNNLTRLDEESLAELSSLSILRLSHNAISHIAEGAFKGLKSLRVLDLDHNEISGTIEDTSGAFTGLDNLSKLTLFGNKIKSVAKRAFSGLESLEHLNLGENAIRSVQFDAFAKMKNLKELYISSESFLCDCQLKWLPPWLMGRMLQAFVTATCAHPESLKGQSIFSVLPDSFVCDDFPKPQIITQPETTMAVVGKDIRFTCSAASSSSSPMTFAWKKDNEVLANADMENFAHVRAQDGEVMEYTTILHLRHVTFGHEGRYQCIITNHFGSTYSHKARLTVNVLPSFTKIPHDIAIRTGTTARLECAATGHPNPQIAWQKDGGTDFPAARERRMHVMPEDDVFFIVDVKIEDIGVYSCTAQNSAGSVSANATLTVLETPSFLRPLLDRTVTKGETAVLQCIAGGSPPPRLNWTKDDSPLVVTERHFFAAGNQLLIIVDSDVSDAGKYTCEMSNTLGTERGNVRLSVIPTPTCDSPHMTAPSLDGDGWATVGVVIIAVVCCVVGTSLVWVVIIYHTRRRNEDCSITNTDETNLPADIPSYLSSQGTLADRQDGYISSESGSHHQFVTSSGGGFFLPQHDGAGTCHFDDSSEADVEAASDPFLCPFVGSTGPVYLQGNLYSPDPFEVYLPGCSSDPRTALMDHCESSYVKQDRFSCARPSEEPCERSLKSIPWPHSRKLTDSTYPPNEGHTVQTLCLNKSSVDFSTGPEPGSATSSNSFMGTFGKPLRRPHLDAFSSSAQPPDCQPRPCHGKSLSSPELDSESEENDKERTDFREENHRCTYQQIFHTYRTPDCQPCDSDT